MSMEGDEPTNNNEREANTPPDHETQPEKTKEQLELELIAKLRLSFGSVLHMLEAARDNLALLGNRMDRLRETSRQCREALGVVAVVKETKKHEMEDDDESMDSSL